MLTPKLRGRSVCVAVSSWIVGTASAVPIPQAAAAVGAAFGRRQTVSHTGGGRAPDARTGRGGRARRPAAEALGAYESERVRGEPAGQPPHPQCESRRRRWK